MGSIPLPALDIQPAPNPLNEYAKALSVKNLMGQGQIQQQAIQSGGIDLQMKGLALKNMQVTQSAMADPKLTDEFNDWEKSKGTTPGASATGAATGATAGVQLHPFAQFLLEKHGLPLLGPGGAMELSQGLFKENQDVATLLKTQGDTAKNNLEAHSKQLENFTNEVAPIFEETDPAKQQQQLGTFKNKVLTNQEDYPKELVNRIGGVNSISDLAGLANFAPVHQRIIEDATKLAQAQKTQLEIASVTPDRLNAVNKTINSYTALNPQQKQSAISEAQNARTVDELNKVQDRWDTANRAEQMHQESMAQSRALIGTRFADQGLAANDKTWSAFNQTRAQTMLGKNSIKAGADGNGLITSLAPTMEVLGMNSFAQTRRISPAEAQAAGAPGGWAEQANAWFDKASQGKISPQLAKEGTALFDQLLDAKYAESLTNSQMHARGYGIPPQNMPAMDKQGNVTTLDKVQATGGAGGGSGHVIAIGDKQYRYNGAGATNDLNNYTEIKKP